MSEAAPSELRRFNRLRSVTVSANLAPGYSLGEALQFMDATAERVLKPGYSTELNGVSREFRSSSGALGLVFVLAQANAALECDVELFFTATSIRLLQKQEQSTLVGYGPKRQTLGDILEQTRAAGAQFHACSQAMQQLGLQRGDLVPCEIGGVLQFSARLTDPHWHALVV